MIRMIQTIIRLSALLAFSLFALESPAKEVVLQVTANKDIRQGFADAAHGQVHYWQAGKGPVLLLIHQSSSSSEEFAGLVPYLKDQFRLVAFDWAGQGASDDPPEEFGVDEHTNSALAVLDALNIQQFHVLGHHGGALLAMNLAYLHPDRVDRLVLSGTSGIKTEEESKEFAASLNLKKRNTLALDGRSLSDAWQRFVGYLPNSAPEEVLVPYLNNVNARLRPYEVHHGILRWDRKPALASIRDKRVLLTQGVNDVYVSHQENLLERLPNAKRQVLEDAGVFVFFEKPKETSKMIQDFLNAD